MSKRKADRKAPTTAPDKTDECRSHQEIRQEHPQQLCSYLVPQFAELPHNGGRIEHFRESLCRTRDKTSYLPYFFSFLVVKLTFELTGVQKQSEAPLLHVRVERFVSGIHQNLIERLTRSSIGRHTIASDCLCDKVISIRRLETGILYCVTCQGEGPLTPARM